MLAIAFIQGHATRLGFCVAAITAPRGCALASIHPKSLPRMYQTQYSGPITVVDSVVVGRFGM